MDLIREEGTLGCQRKRVEKFEHERGHELATACILVDQAGRRGGGIA